MGLGMEVEQGTWEIISIITASGIAAGGWLYSRMSGGYKALESRMDKIVNHMTAKDNKIHARIDGTVERLAYIAVLDSRMEQFGKVQDETLKEVKELNQSMRHRVGNIEQAAVRVDERLKHLEKTAR